MFQILTVAFYFIAAGRAAPATPAGVTSLVAPIPSAQQYILLPSQSHYQLQPALKLQQPVVHQLNPLGRIQTPKDQLYVLYPNTPLSQYPVLLRQDSGNTDWWIAVQNFFQNIGGNIISESPNEAIEKPSEETGPKIEIEKDAEKIPAKILAPVQPLSMEKRFYIISGQPQFYGNFDALNNPVGPLVSLQPLQAIKARSAAESIQAEAAIELDTKSIPAQSELLPAADIVAPMEEDNLQLRSNLPGSTQELLNAENDPSVVAVQQQLARYLSEAKSQAISNSENVLVQNGAANTLRKDELSSIKEPSFNLDEEASIAQAKPNAISVSGRGGVSSSSPVATALVGDGGLALASPSATAVAGEFDDDDIDEDKKVKGN